MELNASPLERARAIETVILEGKLSYRAAAKYLGIEIEEVHDYMALLSMSEDMQRIVEQRPDLLPLTVAISTVQDANTRARLLEMVAAGEPESQVRSSIEDATGPGKPSEDAQVVVDAIDRAIERIRAMWPYLTPDERQAVRERWQGWPDR